MKDAVIHIALLACSADSDLLIEQVAGIDQANYQVSCFVDVESFMQDPHFMAFDIAVYDCRQHLQQALLQLAALKQQAPLPLVAWLNSLDASSCEAAYDVGVIDCLSLKSIQSEILYRSFRYVQANQTAQQRWSEASQYDALTGIPNRQMFCRELESALLMAETQHSSLGLLLINLDGFKRVNESYTLEAADELVCTVSRRLNRCVRKSDCFARMGADEFALLLDDCRGREAAASVAKKIIDILADPYMLEGAPVIISCSIGIAFYPESSDTVDGLLKRANLAMLEAKSQRGSQYEFYSEKTQEQALDRANLERDLRLALRRNAFKLFHQPRVNLLSGETVGTESLIRWQHPNRGWVSPAEFIPVAEECGLIVPIGYWVIQQACKDMKRFDEQGKTNLHVAVNLSFKQLQEPMFVETAARIIKDSGIDATRLEFELTETAVMSNFQQTYEGMMALSQLGVRFSLDDFGTGFSSFAHLQRLPISALKIDCSFIRNVEIDKNDAEIVKSMISLAASLGLEIIAEGVESLSQIQFLWQHKCLHVQGYYFSPAVPVEDLNNLIDDRSTVMK